VRLLSVLQFRTVPWWIGSNAAGIMQMRWPPFRRTKVLAACIDCPEFPECFHALQNA
jgi:hypothetical protein